MKKILLLICLFSLACCNKDSDLDTPIIEACDTDNPIEDIPWLSTLAKGLNEDESDLATFFFIEMAEYKSETIFISNNCCPICGTVVPIYNCEGKLLSFLNDEIKVEDIKNVRIIFKGDDFSCQ